MIVTLTLNPSVDRTLEIAALERGAVLRATASRVHPGGKGVNVARALVANAHRARAVLPVGGREGELLLDLLSGLGVEIVPVGIEAPIRENVSIVEPDGTVTKVNAPGPHLDHGDIADLVKATVEAAGDADWVALCGALPPTAPADLYRRLVEELHAAGARVALDGSGWPLAEAVGAGPELVKPNAAELAEVTGRTVATMGDVVAGARDLLARGVGAALVSLGSAGAALVSPTLSLHASTPPVTARSNVGAGDATLAGFLAAGRDGPDALRTAVAWGAAAVGLPGTQMPAPADIDTGTVRVEEIDLERPLGEEGRAG